LAALAAGLGALVSSGVSIALRRDFSSVALSSEGLLYKFEIGFVIVVSHFRHQAKLLRSQGESARLNKTLGLNQNKFL
jgi:hypothetical protein